MDQMRIFATVIRYPFRAASKALVVRVAAHSAPCLKRIKAKRENLTREKTEPGHQDLVRPTDDSKNAPQKAKAPRKGACLLAGRNTHLNSSV
jgi:hypothetical protein